MIRDGVLLLAPLPSACDSYAIGVLYEEGFFSARGITLDKVRPMRASSNPFVVAVQGG